MNKFTIFTVLLAVSVMTVTVDLALRDYFDVGSEDISENLEESAVLNSEAESAQASVISSEVSHEAAAEFSQASPTYVLPPTSATLTQARIQEAGFSGILTEKHFNGKIFQLLDITKIPVDAMGFYEILQNGAAIVSLTEVALQDEIRALQLYVLLQNKTKPYIDLSLNETNAYGDRSFYINHANKPEEAFLTVKIGKMIYGFAYVKFYHPQIKKLIALLSE